MRSIPTLALTLAALLVSPAGATAQQHDSTMTRDHGMMALGNMMSMMSCPMMGGGMVDHTLALAHADSLGLTAAQRRQLLDWQEAADRATAALTDTQRAALLRLQRREMMRRMMQMMEHMMQMEQDGAGDGMPMRDTAAPHRH